MARTDYASAFRINAASGQAAQSPYAQHVEEMVIQILLTDPGERVDLPTFGCGLRRLLFAPNSDALQATAQLIVQQNLTQWLGSQIQVQAVTVDTGPNNDASQLLIEVQYVLVETQSLQTTSVQVS
jgi:phage baseplate assembly protein W